MLLVVILVILLIIYLIYKYKTAHITALIIKDHQKYNNKLKQFEHSLSQWYPLGSDHFRIDHGPNYYKFFERLGQVNFGVCMDNHKIIATCCAIKRNVYLRENSLLPTKVTYLCDLKVAKDYRGKLLPFKMLTTLGPSIDLLNAKIYGVTMDKTNKIIKLAKSIPLLHLKSGGKLYIYSLDYEKMLRAFDIIKHYRPNVSFTNLTGIKDLILQSTNKPMKILHLQHNAGNISTPQKDYTHMFCCHETDPLIDDLAYSDITTNITATIIHTSNFKSDWSFITTASI
jgi:hypothetical protein